MLMNNDYSYNNFDRGTTRRVIKQNVQERVIEDKIAESSKTLEVAPEKKLYDADFVLFEDIDHKSLYESQNIDSNIIDLKAKARTLISSAQTFIQTLENNASITEFSEEQLNKINELLSKLDNILSQIEGKNSDSKLDSLINKLKTIREKVGEFVNAINISNSEVEESSESESVVTQFDLSELKEGYNLSESDINNFFTKKDDKYELNNTAINSCFGKEVNNVQELLDAMKGEFSIGYIYGAYSMGDAKYQDYLIKIGEGTGNSVKFKIDFDKIAQSYPQEKITTLGQLRDIIDSGKEPQTLDDNTNTNITLPDDEINNQTAEQQISEAEIYELIQKGSLSIYKAQSFSQTLLSDSSVTKLSSEQSSERQELLSELDNLIAKLEDNNIEGKLDNILDALKLTRDKVNGITDVLENRLRNNKAKELSDKGIDVIVAAQQFAQPILGNSSIKELSQEQISLLNSHKNAINSLISQIESDSLKDKCGGIYNALQDALNTVNSVEQKVNLRTNKTETTTQTNDVNDDTVTPNNTNTDDTVDTTDSTNNQELPETTTNKPPVDGDTTLNNEVDNVAETENADETENATDVKQYNLNELKTNYSLSDSDIGVFFNKKNDKYELNNASINSCFGKEVNNVEELLDAMKGEFSIGYIYGAYSMGSAKYQDYLIKTGEGTGNSVKFKIDFDKIAQSYPQEKITTIGQLRDLIDSGKKPQLSDNNTNANITQTAETSNNDTVTQNNTNNNDTVDTTDSTNNQELPETTANKPPINGDTTSNNEVDNVEEMTNADETENATDVKQYNLNELKTNYGLSDSDIGVFFNKKNDKYELNNASINSCFGKEVNNVQELLDAMKGEFSSGYIFGAYSMGSEKYQNYLIKSGNKYIIDFSKAAGDFPQAQITTLGQLRDAIDTLKVQSSNNNQVSQNNNETQVADNSDSAQEVANADAVVNQLISTRSSEETEKFTKYGSDALKLISLTLDSTDDILYMTADEIAEMAEYMISDYLDNDLTPVLNDIGADIDTDSYIDKMFVTAPISELQANMSSDDLNVIKASIIDLLKKAGFNNDSAKLIVPDNLSDFISVYVDADPNQEYSLFTLSNALAETIIMTVVPMVIKDYINEADNDLQKIADCAKDLTPVLAEYIQNEESVSFNQIHDIISEQYPDLTKAEIFMSCEVALKVMAKSSDYSGELTDVLQKFATGENVTFDKNIYSVPARARTRGASNDDANTHSTSEDEYNKFVKDVMEMGSSYDDVVWSEQDVEFQRRWKQAQELRKNYPELDKYMDKYGEWNANAGKELSEILTNNMNNLNELIANDKRLGRVNSEGETKFVVEPLTKSSYVIKPEDCSHSKLQIAFRNDCKEAVKIFLSRHPELKKIFKEHPQLRPQNVLNWNNLHNDFHAYYTNNYYRPGQPGYEQVANRGEVPDTPSGRNSGANKAALANDDGSIIYMGKTYSQDEFINGLKNNNLDGADLAKDSIGIYANSDQSFEQALEYQQQIAGFGKDVVVIAGSNTIVSDEDGKKVVKHYDTETNEYTGKSVYDPVTEVTEYYDSNNNLEATKNHVTGELNTVDNTNPANTADTTGNKSVTQNDDNTSKINNNDVVENNDEQNNKNDIKYEPIKDKNGNITGYECTYTDELGRTVVETMNADYLKQSSTITDQEGNVINLSFDYGDVGYTVTQIDAYGNKHSTLFEYNGDSQIKVGNIIEYTDGRTDYYDNNMNLVKTTMRWYSDTGVYHEGTKDEYARYVSQGKYQTYNAFMAHNSEFATWRDLDGNLRHGTLTQKSRYFANNSIETLTDGSICKREEKDGVITQTITHPDGRTDVLVQNAYNHKFVSHTRTDKEGNLYNLDQNGQVISADIKDISGENVVHVVPSDFYINGDANNINHSQVAQFCIDNGLAWHFTGNDAEAVAWSFLEAMKNNTFDEWYTKAQNGEYDTETYWAEQAKKAAQNQRTGTSGNQRTGVSGGSNGPQNGGYCPDGSYSPIADGSGFWGNVMSGVIGVGGHGGDVTLGGGYAWHNSPYQY